MPYYYEVIPLSQINEGLTYQSNEQIVLGSICLLYTSDAADEL